MNDKTKIVHISSYYPPHLGGLEKVAQEIPAQLAKDEYATVVLTSNIGAKHLPHIEAQPNLTVKRLRAFDFAHTAFIPTLLWELLKVKKPAIFHLHFAQAYVPEMVWLASKLRGIPYIVHYHLDVEPSGRLGFIFVWWKKWVQPVIIKGAAHVITLSPDQSKIIEERYKIPASKVTFIGNGVGGDFLKIGEGRHGIHTPLRLLSVGRLHVQKRPERLIEAMSLIKVPVTLTLVGDGEDRTKHEALAEKLGLKNVFFRGILLGNDLLNAYRDADVFVISSDREGMSLAILEAMGAGLPVIGSNVLGIAEFVGETGILVKNPSAETFAKAIEDVANDPQALQALGAASLKKAQMYSWSKLVNKLEGLYKELLP